MKRVNDCILDELLEILTHVSEISLSQFRSVVSVTLDEPLDAHQVLILNSRIKFSDQVKQSYSPEGETMYIKMAEMRKEECINRMDKTMYLNKTPR